MNDAERARAKVIRDAGYAWCEAMMGEDGDVWLRALPNGDIEQLTIYDDHFQFETIASPPGGES